MRKTILCFLCIFVLCSLSSAVPVVTSVSGGTDSPTSLQSNVGGISVGYLKVGTKEVGNIAWHPDFKFGPWGLGADVNFALGEDKPADYENLVLRYVEYDDRQKGIRYGVIDNLTWGHGLLMSGYSTRMYSTSVIPNNEQMAVTGYVTFDRYAVRGLTTRTGVNGLRVEEQINPMLTLGQTVIADTKMMGKLVNNRMLNNLEHCCWVASILFDRALI